MNFRILPSLFLFLALGFTANAQTDAFTLRVEGLGCPFCAYGLEKKFKDVKGIDDLAIDIKTGEMTFEVPAATALTLDEADARVTKAGYVAKGIAVTRASGETESVGDVGTAVAPADMTADAETRTETFAVRGNCGMCKARIEKVAGGVKGVASAVWDQDAEQLTVVYTGGAGKLEDVQEAVAASGHDNAGAEADDDAYDALPPCCQYKRS